MLNRLFVVDSVTLTSTGTAVSTYTPWDQTTRKLPTQVVVKATGQGAYVRLSNDNSAATNADVLVQGGDHVVLSVQGRRWVSVLSDGASSTVNVGALSTGVSGSAASLDLAFVDAGVLDPRVTFTRASTATYFNSAGVLTSAAINESRRDFDPATLAVRGLLIEEARTNSIRNNTMQGAVAGTPGTVPTFWTVTSTTNGITREVVGTGTEDGISYVDIRFYGTAIASLNFAIGAETNTQVVASTGQQWTGSLFMRLISGSYANLSAHSIFLNSYTAAGGFDANAATITYTYPAGGATNAALRTQRYVFAGTLNSATTARVNTGFFAAYNAGAAIDITLRIGLPQLELGAFATSVIPTTTTALTRSADVASVNTLSPWFNSAAGTLFAQGILVGGTASAFPYQAALVGSAVNNDSIGIQWTANTGVMRFGIRTGAVIQADIPGAATKSANSSFKVAGRYATNDAQAAFDGTLGTPDTTVTLPTITALSLGGAVGFQPGASVWLQRVTFYPRGLSNAELQAITA